MLEKRLCPRLSPDFRFCARKYAFDVLAMLSLFVAASLLAGRVWRFPFDDELITLAPIERSRSALELLIYYLKGADIHPPLSFLTFYGLRQLGLSEAGLRLCSLAMTALSLALFHLVALTIAALRSAAFVRPATRLIAVLLFALVPLAIGQGDAIRWYPPFAALISMFVLLYAFGDNGAARLASAAVLGLAVSTNFIATLVVAPFIVFRYALQRRFRLPFELGFWAVVLLFASPGAISAYSLFAKRFGSVMHTEFGHGATAAALTDLLGFFGGNALGVSQIWIVVPAIAIAVAAAIFAADRRQSGNPLNFLLLMLAAAVLMPLAGFAKPRSFLYLAPIVALFVTLWLNHLLRARRVTLALGLAAVWIAGSAVAIAQVDRGTHPFKRSAVIPYQNILDFIDGNTTGRVLVLSTDPVVPWVLSHRNDGGNRCVGYFMEAGRCLVSAVRYDSVVVITGHSDKSARAVVMAGFKRLVDTATAGLQKTAKLQAGRDDDAALKSWLTGVPLSENILTVEVYR